MLHSDNDTKHIFNEKPFVVYRSNRNLKDILVRSRLHVHSALLQGMLITPSPDAKICCFVIKTLLVRFSKGDFKIKETITSES